MASAGGRSRKVLVSAAAAQSAIGTYASVDSSLRVSSEPGELVPDIGNDMELIGGSEESTDQELEARHYELPLAQSRCKPHTLAFIAASALGTVSTTTPAAGGVYLHTITPKTAKDFSLFTVEELLKTGYQLKYGDCFVDSFELRMERRRPWDITAQVLGSGKYTTDTSSQSEVSEKALHTRFTEAWLSVGTFDNVVPTQAMGTENLTGSPDVISTEVESLRWAYGNNTDQDFQWHFNSGLTWGRAERADRTQTISATLLMARTAAVGRVMDQDECALQLKAVNTADQIGATAYYTGASIIFPKLMYTRARPVGAAGDRMRWEVEMSVKQHATYGSARVYLWNGQAAYLA